MDEKLTFAQWQSSRGISPWVYSKKHIRFGIEDATKAVDALSKAWPQFEEKMRVVTKQFNKIAKALEKKEY